MVGKVPGTDAARFVVATCMTSAAARARPGRKRELAALRETMEERADTHAGRFPLELPEP